MSELDPSFASQARQFTGAEVPLNPSEIIVSRSDGRGVVLSGNAVFQRMTGRSWDELLGAPHKVIRHPDMPKAVFHLMWARLQAGLPIGAYVKNRDKAGGYYWVFAVIAPTQDGYISIRIKPMGPMRSKVEALYADLLKAEQAENGLKPEESANRLKEEIKALGFSNYAAFQATAIAEEFEARAKHLGEDLDQPQRRFLNMSRAISDVRRETTEMTEAFKAIRTVPMNMRIIASRLENAGGPISAISVNYSQMLEEMSTWVKTFVDGEDCVFALIRDAILNGQFLGFVAVIEELAHDIINNQKDSYPNNIDVEADLAALETNRSKFLGETAQALGAVETEAKRFGRSVLDMKRYVTGLSSTRMMCKIENAALMDSGSDLAGVVEQLDACQDEIEARLAKIVELNAVIQGNVSMLRSLL